VRQDSHIPRRPGAYLLVAIACASMALAAQASVAAGQAPPAITWVTPPSGMVVKVAGPPRVLSAQGGGGAPSGAAGSTGLAVPAPAAACPLAAPSPLCNMTYHNGPVLHTTITHVIYWQPAGFSFQANYGTVLQQYLADVATDGGRVSNPYATDTQYSDSVNGNILYSQTFAGAVTDTDPFPAQAAGCVIPAAAGVCLTQTQEQTELNTFLAAKSLPRTLNDIYFLVLPKTVQTCFDNFTDCGPYGPATVANSSGAFPEFCAYHSSFGTAGGPVDWANMPDGADGGCNIVPTAPNNVAADTLIDSLSHEHNEAITNPSGGGWYDVNNSGENGDKCNDTFAPAIASNASGGYDVLINHHGYEIQPEWSNAITGCAMNFGAAPPTASFTTSPSAPLVGDTVTFSATASSPDAGGYIANYSWDFGDGTTTSTATGSTTHSYAASGTYTVRLTVTDDAGLTATATGTVVVTGPTVTAVFPNFGAWFVVHLVTITGTMLSNVREVDFGPGHPALFIPVSSTLLFAWTPIEFPGTVDVTVRTNLGTSGITSGDRYTFTPF
jgi:PKD repeat protein